MLSENQWNLSNVIRIDIKNPLEFQTVSPLRLDMPPNKDAAADLIWSLPNAQCPMPMAALH